MSTTLDGATALASTSLLVGAMQNRLMLGLFVPLQDGARSPTSASNKKIKDLARARAREVRTVINPHVISRETEKDAWE